VSELPDLQQRLVDALYGPGHRRSDSVEELADALISIAKVRTPTPVTEDVRHLTADERAVFHRSLRASVDIVASPSPPKADGPGEDGWQPIETAPKDGTEIQVFARTEEGAEMQQVAHWDGAPTAEWPWQVSDGSAYHRGLFTHWRPLPIPPKEA